MFAWSAAHGTMLFGEADEYSGWKLNGNPLQLPMLVFMKPFAAEATMNPDCPVVRSEILVSKAWPPPVLASKMRTLSRSPGFMSRVFALGVKVARSASCGLGGPAGTPLVWIIAKLMGSTQLLLQWPKFVVHSRLSMVMAEHQWVLSQLAESTMGAMPGG